MPPEVSAVALLGLIRNNRAVVAPIAAPAMIPPGLPWPTAPPIAPPTIALPIAPPRAFCAAACCAGKNAARTKNAAATVVRVMTVLPSLSTAVVVGD
jgi:hypothetical protein